ncbi:MAG: hypothetical protein N0C84_00895 [Candidatus Thiodiazotropha taylori]|uniref:Uncharacterized protein n=1 Tax=Candidatus Thiodiazotropha taylori TaxID=2792791 RepID=A0A9E4K8K9_9GAMM|nr:hypothetical protein [Candidatus Thiodiazotropha taylori]MCW4255002.1 hypothetical protein [Candidatus Thiodiazotropha taylori]
MAKAPKQLREYLQPDKGDSVPLVYDHGGTPVSKVNGNLLTDTYTAVDLGDTPNSNNGDPLRLAFAKINNFVEAVYHYTDDLHDSVQTIDQSYVDGVLNRLTDLEDEPKIVSSTTEPTGLRNGIDFWDDTTNNVLKKLQGDGTFIEY